MTSISRKKTARLRQATLGRKPLASEARSGGAAGDGLERVVADAPAGLSSVDDAAKKKVDQMSLDESRLTGEWFTAYIVGLDDARLAVEAAIPRARAADQPDLIAQKDELMARRIDATQQKHAFFESKTVSLRAPTQKVIDETVRLSKAIADRIAAEKRAQAIVKLVNDLAGVLTKLIA